ncbi:MAG: AAA family ATPase [Candidatus Thorarchaeota archaeon]
MKIHRYKSIEQLEMTRLDSLNVLVGENGSGKTNVLELLLLFFQEFSRIGRTTSQLSPEHWYKREQSKPIEIHIDLDFTQQELEKIFGSPLAEYVRSYLEENVGYISISTSLSSNGQWSASVIHLGNIPLHKEGEQLELHAFLNKVDFRIQAEDLFLVKPETDTEKQWATPEGVPYLLDDQRKEAHRLDLSLVQYLDTLSQIQLGLTLEEWIKKEDIANSNAISLVDYKIQNVNQNLDALSEIVRESLLVVETIARQSISPVRTESIPPSEVQEILSFYDSPDGQKQEIWFNFKEKFERVFGGRLLRVENQIQYELNQRRYSLSSVGGGHASWFRLLWQISQNRNKILLLEEPESHMHPRLAKSVGLFLHEATKDNQIFFTTHSTVFLDQCNYNEIWLVRYLETDGTKVQRIENFENLRDIALMLGITPSDILYSNNILFVEGRADKTYIQAAADLLGIRLFPTRVGVLPIEGVGKARFHLEVFREAVNASGTPFFILLDGDTDAVKKGEELLKKGLVTEEQILNLARRDIENYYPEELFFEALNEEYNLNTQEADMIRKAISSDT